MSETTEEFPKVQGGGSLILAWQIKGKKVLIVGGGEVSYNTKFYSHLSRLLTKLLSSPGCSRPHPQLP